MRTDPLAIACLMTSLRAYRGWYVHRILKDIEDAWSRQRAAGSA